MLRNKIIDMFSNANSCFGIYLQNKKPPCGGFFSCLFNLQSESESRYRALFAL
jgi:hypothetical protein